MRRAKLQVDGFGVSLEGMGPCGQSNQIMNAYLEKREKVRRKIEAIPALVDLVREISEWAMDQWADETPEFAFRATHILKQIDGVKDEVR